MLVGIEMLGIEGRPGSDGKPGRLTVGMSIDGSNDGIGIDVGTAMLGSDGRPGRLGSPGLLSEGNPHDIYSMSVFRLAIPASPVGPWIAELTPGTATLPSTIVAPST